MALTFDSFALPPLTLATDAEYPFIEADSPNWLGFGEESSSWDRSSSPDSFDTSEDSWATPEPAPLHFLSPVPSPLPRLISPLVTPKSVPPQANYFNFYEAPASQPYPTFNSVSASPVPSPLSNPFMNVYPSPLSASQVASQLPPPLQPQQSVSPPSKRAPKKAPAHKKTTSVRKSKENKLQSSLAWSSSTNSSDPDNQVLIGRYTQQERRARIASYLQKRLQRSLVKKVIYGCRKVFADARPRVGGRFVKLSDLESWTSQSAHSSSQPVAAQ